MVKSSLFYPYYFAEEENGPWWKGELEQEYEIHKVVITNDRLASQGKDLQVRSMRLIVLINHGNIP